MATTISETMNVKGQRKVVMAKYTTEYLFKLPDGLDLEDTEVVDSWGIKYNTLFIYWVDTTKPTTEIESVRECEPDYKYPDNDDELKIRDAEDFGYEYSEDEDEETCGKCNNNLEPSKECFDCEVAEEQKEVGGKCREEKMEEEEKKLLKHCYSTDKQHIEDIPEYNIYVSKYFENPNYRSQALILCDWLEANNREIIKDGGGISIGDNKTFDGNCNERVIFNVMSSKTETEDYVWLNEDGTISIEKGDVFG